MTLIRDIKPIEKLKVLSIDSNVIIVEGLPYSGKTTAIKLAQEADSRPISSTIIEITDLENLKKLDTSESKQKYYIRTPNSFTDQELELWSEELKRLLSSSGSFI